MLVAVMESSRSPFSILTHSVACLRISSDKGCVTIFGKDGPYLSKNKIAAESFANRSEKSAPSARLDKSAKQSYKPPPPSAPKPSPT